MHPLEAAVNNSLAEYKANHDFGQALWAVVAPFKPLLDSQGVSVSMAVQQLLGAHRNLMSPNAGVKFAQFARIATFYGISLRDFIATRAQTAEEVSAFADDPAHPFFDEVSGDVIALMTGDSAITLGEAYQRAVWGNPMTREKELARLQATWAGNVSEEQRPVV